MTRKRRRKQQQQQSGSGGESPQQKKKYQQKQQHESHSNSKNSSPKEIISVPSPLPRSSTKEEGESVAVVANEEGTAKLLIRIEEDIALYEASLEILKSRKQEVIKQIDMKRSQKLELLQEQMARTEQKKRLETAQVRHLQLLQELKKSLSKSQERLKRLASSKLVDGILSTEEINNLLTNEEISDQELQKQNQMSPSSPTSPGSRKRSLPFLYEQLRRRQQQLKEESNKTTESTVNDETKLQKKESTPTGHHIVYLRDVCKDKNNLFNFWKRQVELNPKFNNIFLPSVRSKDLLIKIMNIYAQETLALDALYITQNHRRDTIQSTGLNIKLCCASPRTIPSSFSNKQKDILSEAKRFLLSAGTANGLECLSSPGMGQTTTSDSIIYTEKQEPLFRPIACEEGGIEDFVLSPNNYSCGETAEDAMDSTITSSIDTASSKANTRRDKKNRIVDQNESSSTGRALCLSYCDAEEDSEKFADSEEEEDNSHFQLINSSCKSTIRISPHEKNADGGKPHHHDESIGSPNNSEEEYEDAEEDNLLSPTLYEKKTILKLTSTREKDDYDDSITQPTVDQSNHDIIDPNISLCPYELSGICADAYCPYQHLMIRRHGKILPRELLPLPVLKLPPEPVPANEKITQPNSSADNKMVEDKNKLCTPMSNASSGVAKGADSMNDTLAGGLKQPLIECSVPVVESIAAESEPQSESEVSKIAPDFDINRNDDKLPPCKKQRIQCLTKLNRRFETISRKSQHEKESDFIFTDNSDFVPLGFISSDESSAASVETSSDNDDEDDIDLITEYLDKVRKSKQKVIWWMTKEQIASLDQLSCPLCITEWFHLLGGLRIVEDGQSKLLVEGLELCDVNNGFQASILFGRLVDCLRLAVHAGRFDISGALLFLASEVVNELQTSRSCKYTFKLLRDVLKRVKRIHYCAYERQSSFRASFDLQLLLALISIFIQQLHTEHLSSAEVDINEEIHSKWSSNMYDICRAIQPPGELDQKIIRNPEKIVSDIRQKLFQLSPAISETLDLVEGGSNCECTQSMSLLSDVRLANSCRLNLREASSLSVVTEEILQPVWSVVKGFLRQHSTSEDRQRMYLRGSIFICFLVFGALENIVDNFVDVEVDSSTTSGLIQVDYTIQRILFALRASVSDEPFLEILLTPLFAGCTSLSIFLRQYGSAQYRLETFLWTVRSERKHRCNGTGARNIPLTVYSELLWSQLLQLRSSLPFCTSVAGEAKGSRDSLLFLKLPIEISEGHEVLAHRIRQYGVHLHHLYLEGDWNLLHQLHIISVHETDKVASVDKYKMKSKSKALKDACFELVQSMCQTNLDGTKNINFNLSDTPFVSPGDTKVTDASSNFSRSAFPRSLLVGGEMIFALRLSGCLLQNLPVTFGTHFPNVKKLDISNNQLKILPDSIGLMSNLLEINASHNRLSSLPDSIASIKPLQHLDFSYNLLQKLPISLRYCNNLEKINATFNLLSSDGEDLYAVTQLTKLRMLKIQPQLPVKI